RHRPEIPYPDLDRDAVPEGAKLLEALGTLEAGLGQAGEPLERRGVEAVEADVRQRSDLAGAARVGDQRAREVERVAFPVEDHLDHLREVLLAGLERARDGGHAGAAADQPGQRADRLGIDQGLVALDVEVACGGHLRRGPRDAFGPVPALHGRHDDGEAGPSHFLCDALVVGGDGPLVHALGPRPPPGHAHDHRGAPAVGERVPGESSRRGARRYDRRDAHDLLYSGRPAPQPVSFILVLVLVLVIESGTSTSTVWYSLMPWQSSTTSGGRRSSSARPTRRRRSGCCGGLLR